MRDANDAPDLARARLFVGPVVSATSPEDARRAVRELAALKPDWIKIRVDDNLGTTTKMAPEVYRAVIEEAHAVELPVAAHLFYLEDAKALVHRGQPRAERGCALNPRRRGLRAILEEVE